MVNPNQTRIYSTFNALVNIPSPSKREGTIINYIKERMEKMGLKCYIQTNEHLDGFDTGNLICWIDSTNHDVTDEEPIFFCTHVDTVQHENAITVVEDHEYFYSDGSTILGADPKMAIACMLECATIIKRSQLCVRPIEFIFTVGEEIGSLGVKTFDFKQMKSETGYILDHTGPVGTIVYAGNYHASLHISLQHITGESVSKEMKQMIQRIKRIPLRCHQEMAVRDLTSSIQFGNHNIACIIDIYGPYWDDIKDVQQQISLIFKEIDNTNNYLLKTFYKKSVDGYEVDKKSDLVQAAARSAIHIGVTPRFMRTNYLTDTNYFNVMDKRAINLGVAYENIHTYEEQVSKIAFIQLTKLLLALSEKNTMS